MTIKRMIFILLLVAALCGAKFAYDKYYGPQQAAAMQQEEAAKLRQLEADLIRAAETGRRNTSTKSPPPRTIRRTTTGST